MKKIYFPIKLKLTLWYVTLLIIVIIAFSVTIYFSLQRMIIINEDTLLKSQVAQTIATLDVENGRLKPSEAPFYANTNFYGTLLSYPDMKIVESNLSDKILKLYMPKDSGFIGKYKTITNGDNKWRIYSEPIYSEHKKIGILILAQPLNLAYIAINNLFVLFIYLIPFIVIIAILGGLLLANKALKPISYMTKIAREISMGDLSKRLNLPYTNDEIGKLAQTFDMMLDKIDISVKKQRQFTHDASHELRTPIAVIQSRAESMLATKYTDEEYKKSISIILDEAKHMGKLVSNLLFLARGDSNTDKLKMENLNFTELVEGIVDELKPIAQDNNIDIKIIKSEISYIYGDQTRLTQLLYNIIDNAIKYNVPGGKIFVSVETKGKYLKTSIQDTGIGIPAEHLPHIFERFYRVDKARSRKSGGSGLGLSICQWIANVHGGKIDAISREGKGSTFIIWLPLKTQ
ncbi:HAMP domain-containing sensor histidine kinase [Thermoanaerobacterium sp. RBIITD]|uniref:sensor histidine kinase n=1 Tax=Thermoanaerobacterium sp. RBIITD TaxID=1550240 RepID=UPI000BB734C3|nr:HAMP domain-containing sensor histidine kinase [Thermoanaerobacterium sp. RBIITD]SNX53289.1 heavy metal sensor kinase [Thermoanaerobacterium sp. RBIITD]